MEFYNGGVPARSIGGRIIYKKKLSQFKGIPDLIWMFCGDTYFIEVKTSKGVLTKDQKRCHKKMRECGAKVLIWRSLKEAQDAVESLLEQQH